MKTNRFIGLKALMVLTLCATPFIQSCKDNDDQYELPISTISPELKDNKLSFSVDGGSQSITVQTNRRWSASAESDWIAVSPTEGEAGTPTLTITTLKNTKAARTGQVRLQIGSVVHTLTIAQEGVAGESPAEIDATSLKNFITTYDKPTDTNITEEVSFKAVVISDVVNGNTTNKSLQLQAGDVGIIVRFAAAHQYKVGQVLNVTAKGGKVTHFNGLLQLDLSAVAQPQIISEGEGQFISPKTVTLSEVYSNKYQNILIRVDGVQFETPTGKLGDKPYNRLSDCATPAPAGADALSVSISKYASFKDTPMSDKRGSIIGILNVTESNGRKHYNIVPRTLADISLTEERCTEGSTPTPNPTPDAGTSTAMDLSAFITKYHQGTTSVTVQDDVYFEATLISDPTAKTHNGQNYYFQHGDKGIVVRLPKGVEPNFPANSVIRIKAKDAVVSEYNGSLQINFDKLSDALSGGRLTATGNTNSISPKAITVADLQNHSLTNILVTISNVHAATPGQPFNPGKKSYSSLLTDPALSTGTELSIGVASSATFASEHVPAGKGSVTGFLVLNNKGGKYQYSIWPRTRADIKFDGNNDTPAPTPAPAPAPNPSTSTDADPIIVTYVEGSGFNKYIQIYNPSDKPIDLSKYSLKMNSFKGGKHGGDHPAALTGTLAPKAIKVFGNPKGKYTGDQIQDGNLCNFNGDDNVALFKGETLIDLIGTWGSAWAGGKNGAGADVTLHRKAGITKPNATYDASEWDTLAKDDLSPLGKR